MPDRDPPWWRLLATLRRNALLMWPQDAYRQDILVQGFFGRRRLLLNSPAAIHRVLVDNTANYRRSAASVRILRPMVGEGLLLSEGEAWRHQRRTTAPAFTPRIIPILARHIAGAAHGEADRLAGTIGRPVGLLAAMQALALEIAGRSMVSLEMRSHGPAMRAMLAEFAVSLSRTSLLDLLLPVGIPSPKDLRRRRFQARWMALIEQIMAARQPLAAAGEARDLFDLLLAARDPETGAAFTPAQLRDQVATLIVAGHETTGLALFWSLYLLASAPDQQDRLAEEAAGLDLSPRAADQALPRLVFTRAVVSEALRLFPPAFTTVREAIGPDRLDAIAVAPRTLVMISPWVLHRHQRLWAAPEVFDPGRFLPDAAPPPRFAYLPFGAGPRVCIGAQFAMAEAVLVLAILLRRFRVRLAGDRPVLPVGIVTTQPDHPAPFLLSERTA